MPLRFLLILLLTPGCTYNWGHTGRSLPEGFKTVYVEIFDNQTQEVGVEIDFTNALIKEIERSGFAVVANKSSAELIISGTILSMTFTGSASVTGEVFGSENQSASLFTNYILRSMATIKARRSSDKKVVWSTTIDGNTNYQSSKLTQEGLRSSNPLYNQSSRKQTAKLIAKSMMTEAFDRFNGELLMAARKGTSLQDLKNFISLSKGSIVYLSGEEEFFVEESIDHIKKTFLDPFSQDFNYDLFYGREVEISKIFDVIETLPMMAQKRLVIIRQAHELRDQDWKTLMPAIDNPVPSTFLVFAGKKPDTRKSTTKQILQTASLFHYAKPFDREYPQWVQYICKKNNISIDKDAIQLFIQIVGTNLLELQNEIIKVSQFVGGKGHISAADVMSVASRIKLQSIFDLTKAIGESDKARALMCLAQLLENGQNEIGILTMIQRHIRLLRQTKVGEQQGYNGRELSSFAGVPHFFLNEYRRQSQLWSERKIEKTYKVLLDTDKALKSSPISSHIWLENFVMQTCN